MQHLEEQYENLYEFIKNFEIMIQKNIFNGQHIEEINHFGNDIMTLCQSRTFNISVKDLKSLDSFNELLVKSPDISKSYLISQVDNFYTNIIEPSKDEIY